MPYEYPSRVPRVAKHWSEHEKRICARAAQASYLRDHDDAKATFACIGAVKNARLHHKVMWKQDDDQYETQSDRTSQRLQRLIALYFAGSISLGELEKRFKTELGKYYTTLAELGRGGTLTEADLTLLAERLQEQDDYLGGFMADLKAGHLSQQRATWRAGLYGFNRGTFVRFTVPLDVLSLVPVFPGDDCLGGSALCGCSLAIDYESDGSVQIDWVLNPDKEHCEICLAHSFESPWVFSAEDLRSG